MSRTVDLGQLHLAIHALLGDYRERPDRVSRDAAQARLELALRAVEKDLRELGVTDPDTGRARKAAHDPASPLPLEQRRAVLVLLAARDRLHNQLIRLIPAQKRPAVGLLDQLAAPLPGRQADEAGKVTSGKAGSRPPGMLAHLDLLAEIETGVYGHDATLRDLLDAHLPEPLPWQDLLWQIPTLCDQVAAQSVFHGAAHPAIRAVDRDVHSWRSRARTVLSYTAPMVTLTTPCPLCQQVSLIVREDATSDVVCITETCMDPETEQRPRWPRTAWRALLDGRFAAGLVNSDAAALYLGIAPATLRDWKRRGLVQPVGGTARHPLWRVADLDTAAEQARARAQAAAQ
jgi:hypothetical protein